VEDIVDDPKPSLGRFCFSLEVKTEDAVGEITRKGAVNGSSSSSVMLRSISRILPVVGFGIMSKPISRRRNVK
jgi:hypothetical protein